MPGKTKMLFIILISVLSGAGSIQAQYTDTIIPVNRDPVKILRKIDVRKMTSHGFNFWQDDFSGHWAGIDFGFNTFLHKDYSGFQPGFMNNNLFYSNSTYINVIQQSIGLQHNRNTIGLITGLGLHLQSYRLEQNTTIERGFNDVIQPRILFFEQNQKSKLSVVYLTVPLLAEFQIPLNHYKNRLYFSAGLYGSYRVSSHTKIKYRVERKKEKLKTPDFFSLQDYKYGIMVRTGYRWVNLFATYDMVPLFRPEKGPELYPFTFGITLLSF